MLISKAKWSPEMAKLFGQLDLFVVYIFKFFSKLGEKSFLVILGP